MVTCPDWTPLEPRVRPCGQAARQPGSQAARQPGSHRKGTNGVSTNGVTANFMFFDRGTFWVLLLIYFHLPQSARAYLFPQSVKINYFSSGPISVGPICPQPKSARQPGSQAARACFGSVLSMSAGFGISVSILLRSSGPHFRRSLGLGGLGIAIDTMVARLHP